MDPRYSAQDILRCDLCERRVVQSHCELCHTKLCRACVGDHLSDSTRKHRVVPYTERTSTPNYLNCPNHSKNCELYCEQCDLPVCTTCISSGKHKGHHLSDALQRLIFKTRDMEKELKHLETRIYPKYEEIASGFNTKRDSLEKHYRKLTTTVTEHGEDWHREIDIIVNKKSEIDEMKAKHLAALNKKEKEIKHITDEVKQSIVELKNILESNDITLVSVYKSRHAEFRYLPPDLNILLPDFSPQVNTDELYQMFGSLSTFPITIDEHGYTMETSAAVACPPFKSLLYRPELVCKIDTEYHKLYSITSLSDCEIWTLGKDKRMTLYATWGKAQKSIQTKSGKYPHDIAVTKRGDLFYTEPETKTLNIVKNKQIQKLIILRLWIPFNICCTSSGDLLVTMDSVKDEQPKVVRYSAFSSSKIQTIQFDSQGKPLYLPGCYKYISENKNLDICVADNRASAVAVVNQAGKLRFKYTGDPSTTTGSFDPLGITTDSQSQILISDHRNNYIHILDQDGQILSYIKNCDLQRPWGLCVDTRDSLYVAEYISGEVKEIRYMRAM